MNHQWRDNANCMVVWADGTYDHKRNCDECGLLTCKSPVHKDRYKEIGHSMTDDTCGEVGPYWDFMHSVQPLGGKRDYDGENVATEFFTANPDGLKELEPRISGVTEIQYQLAQEVYETFSDRQKQVWDLVMRQQVSQIEVAEQLHITKQAVSTYLNRAKAAFKTFMEENKSRVTPE